MRIFLSLALAGFISACVTTTPAPDASIPNLPDAKSTVSLNEITRAARDSSCAKVDWKNRGVAPLGYTKGMAFAFAKSYCVKRLDGIGGSIKDAVKGYGLAETPVNTFALLHGLGLRESSGQYCEGRDTSASNTSSDTAEAGPFQTSWNAAGSSALLPKITQEYQGGARCFLDVWQEGVSSAHCRAQGSYYGSGSGLAFQKLARSCPQFAAEFAAVTIRVLAPHYGPLVRGEVQLKSECVDMYGKIKKLVDEKPSLCSGL